MRQQYKPSAVNIRTSKIADSKRFLSADCQLMADEDLKHPYDRKRLFAHDLRLTSRPVRAVDESPCVIFAYLY